MAKIKNLLKFDKKMMAHYNKNLGLDRKPVEDRVWSGYVGSAKKRIKKLRVDRKVIVNE